jgi:two-component system response regulator AtoC
MRVLVIDDDAGLRKSVSLILQDAGHEGLLAQDATEGLNAAVAQSPDLILCDVRMPGLDGLEFLRRYNESGGEALVIMMTAYGSLELAVQAMKAGAYDYLPKPFGAEEVLLTLRKAEEREQLRREVRRLREEVRTEARFGDVVARSPAMVRAVEVAAKVARHDSPILVTGETGTGKELIARLIHRESPRRDAAFVPVNCGAIPETLLESEFFGHVRGAFSGAHRDRAGLFESAQGGTLFLDEVGELPPTLQVKLLRALQEGEVRRVGSDETLHVDVRIVAATNQDLEAAAREGRFRQDLYYRLAVVPIHLPSLMGRREEIPELALRLLERHARRLGIAVPRISAAAMARLLEYNWPGNVRELENVLERALVLAEEDEVTADALPEHVRVPVRSDGASRDGGDLSVKRRSAALEKHLIQLALERTGGNRTRAADLLELSPRALRYKIQDYGIDG